MDEKNAKKVYLFEEGSAKMRDVLGGKGCNLAEMTNLGLPIPPGLIITCQACNEYNALGKKFPKGLMEDVKKALLVVEQKAGKKFGDAKNPLLVSVRSGAPVSMPGMMDTVLNLGLNEATLKALVAQTGNERFVYDAYRRFINMFGDVVLGLEHKKFEEILSGKKKAKGVKLDTELDAADLKDVASKYKALVEKETGKKFPEDPMVQLELAIMAVFNSSIVSRRIL